MSNRRIRIFFLVLACSCGAWIHAQEFLQGQEPPYRDEPKPPAQDASSGFVRLP